MAKDTKEELVAALRTALLMGVPRPTSEFRRRAWLAFEAAVDRHLSVKRGGLRRIEPQLTRVRPTQARR